MKKDVSKYITKGMKYQQVKDEHQYQVVLIVISQF